MSLVTQHNFYYIDSTFFLHTIPKWQQIAITEKARFFKLQKRQFYLLAVEETSCSKLAQTSCRPSAKLLSCNICIKEEPPLILAYKIKSNPISKWIKHKINSTYTKINTNNSHRRPNLRSVNPKISLNTWYASKILVPTTVA